MKMNIPRLNCLHRLARNATAVACAILLVPGTLVLAGQSPQTASPQAAKIPADQLDSLVAPIALYPDPMLSQTLVASTYPLEIIQLQQWLERNPGLKDQALVDAVSKQPWDPSVQAMAALPDVVKRLSDDIQWATDLGNAFLAQQSDVMDAVQRMRAKAQGTGALASNDKQTVETEVIENKTVIVVEQADPEVVYVPSYSPEAVYGPPAYPYPAISYPSWGAVAATSAVSWGVGVAMGAAWGGGWGWNAGWGGNDIDIDFDNSFNRNSDFNRENINRGDRTWNHNPEHRGGAPYRDRATADRFGSNARGDSLANRQRSAQQQISRQHGNLPSVGSGAIGDRAKPATGARTNVGDRANVGDRSRGGGPYGGAGGANRVGDRSAGSSSSRGSHGGFGGGSGSYSGSAARSSSHRGSSSLSSSRGGGGHTRGGGGRSGGGGGGRGGGRR